MARRHAERDARIVVVRTVNQGTARARETGIRHAQGDYICFLDGDDVWDSRMLEKLVAAIGENGGYDIVCCDYKRICKTYEAPRREMRTSDMQGLDFLVASLYHAISVTVWGRLYRRALFEKELRHYPLRLGEDSLLNIQIGCQQPRVRFIDYVGYGYVQRGGSANRSPLDIGYCVKFSEAVRAELVRRFNGGEASVFLISLRAGGTGLNLTAADIVIHYDPWWNVAAQNQATDRAYRIGQQNPVQVYKLIAQDTIEEKIVELQQAKQDLAETVTGSADGAILRMKPEELLNLLEGTE
mgnify:CR=1 FL=1